MTISSGAQSPAVSPPVSGLPADWRVDRMTPPELIPITDLASATRLAIEHPLASMPLSDLCGPGTRVCIAVDALREPQLSVLRHLLETLFAQDVDANDVVVLAPAGESAEADLPVLVIVHDPTDLRDVNDLGVFEGVPIRVNHYAAEADVLLGLSARRLEEAVLHTGSDTTITHWLSAATTQSQLRNPLYLDDRLRPQSAGDGLYDRVMREGARRAGLIFAIDVLLDESDHVIAVRAGTPQAVNRELGMISHSSRDTATEGAYDIVIAEAGTNSLYRASQTAIQIGLAPDSALQRGGVLVLPMAQAEAHEPADNDAPEAYDFYEALARGSNTEEVIQLLSRRTLAPGEDRAYLLAHVLQRNPIIAVGLRESDQARHVISVRNISEAAELAETFIGHRPRTLFLSRALSAVPVNTRTAASAADDALVDEMLRDLDI